MPRQFTRYLYQRERKNRWSWFAATAVAILAIPFASWAATDDDAKEGLGKLLGEWQIISTDDGSGPQEYEGLRLVISREKITFRAPDKSWGMGEISRVNPSSNPKQIDLKGNGKTGLGIYELEGDTLKLIVRDPGQGRATEFKGTPQGVLFVLKRDKQ